MNSVVAPQLAMRGMQEEDLTIVMSNEYACYVPPWSKGIMRDCIKSNYVCLVCELDEKAIGHCIMSVAAGEAHILNICIHPRHQGKGLGRKVLRHMVRLASEDNVDTLFLEVRVSNSVAITLYENEGFTEIGVRRAYYPSIEGGKEDAIVYAKPLVCIED